MYKNDVYVRRYSESFKLKVLDELAKGNHSKKQVGIERGIAHDFDPKKNFEQLKAKRKMDG